jgi:outer membrane protein OmpA-like peptidoglycan-associated protein
MKQIVRHVLTSSPILVTAILTATIPAHSNVIGTSTQNFNTTSNGIDFVTVHSSETLEPGLINLGYFLNYAVNTLPYWNTTSQGRLNFNDGMLSSELNAGIGLLHNWDAGISLPYLLNHSVKANDVVYGAFVKNGITEVRFNSKYRLFGDHDFGMALVGGMNLGLIRSDPYAGDNAGPTYNLELVADTTYEKVSVAFNLGFRFRSPGTAISSLIDPLKNQIIASLAASYLLPNSDTKIISEIYTGFPLQKNSADAKRSSTSAEILLGAKHDLNDQWSVHAGGATELLHGRASPDWRVYSGVNYTFGPVFNKKKEAKLETLAGIEENFVISNILFKFNSDQLDPLYTSGLDDLAEILNRPEGFSQVSIEGHTDSVGSFEYNFSLSQRRADAIKKYLFEKHAIPEAKMFTLAHGEAKPIADNGNYQGRQMNRRVEFKIWR